ncbi:MAG: GNAT family N-acetyltransferase [Burkholderiaceae bacterium]
MTAPQAADVADAANAADATDAVAAVRAFNRFYTRRIGVLDEGLSKTGFSLTQARLLWELAHQPQLSASALARELRLDLGYLSRLLQGLKKRGLVKARKHAADGRQSLLSLSAAGRRAFAPLDQGSQAQTGEMLARLKPAQQQSLLAALAKARQLLGEEPLAAPLLRPLRSGDLGWVISRHGALYAQEYGWDLRFEALVAGIAARYVERFDPRLEAGWIAERGGEPGGERLGCVFLVRARGGDDGVEPGVAQLRMLLVEPDARGLGLGRLLVGACHDFARQAGYRRIRLWTNSILGAARAIYQAEGYRLVATEPHHSFGHDLLGETWELELKP